MTRRNSSAQRGVAIITALLVVMLAASIAMFLLAQQSQSLTRAARATGRAQVVLYARPTLDWTRSLLVQAAKNSSIVADTQDWAANIVAQPIEGAVASGFLRDEQGKFNLNNLVVDGKKSQPDFDLFQRLLKQLGLNANLANAVLDWIDPDDDVSSPGGAENGTYFALTPPRRAANKSFVQIEELLRVQGFNADILRRLAPYVTALPLHTTININTASDQLLLALFAPDFDADDVARLIRRREAPLPFASITDIKAYAAHPIPAAVVDQYLDVKSDFFSANLAITGEGGQVRQQALLQRNSALPAQWPSIIWVKDL